MEELRLGEEKQYLPISAIAEILYCPRNFYYRIVESAEEINAHILEGNLLEQKLNQHLSVVRKQYKQIRSVTVSSERLKLIGVLDVVEEGSEIYPVEFKKGELKEKINDDVQICAQAMVLEEKLNCQIDKGYIYYAQSRKRREVFFDGSLRLLVENTIRKGFEIIASKEIPLPLADERCNGCSLFERCMPYEVTHVINNSSKRIIRPLPSLKTGGVLYIDEPGAYVRKKGERIVVTKKDVVLMDFPLCTIEQVILSGTVNMSAEAIKLFLKRGTEVHFLSKTGSYYGCLQPAMTKNSVLRIVQHKILHNSEERLKYAKGFVQGKIANMRTILMRYNRIHKDEKIKKVISQMKEILTNLNNAVSLNHLLGMEGNASKQYFSVFNNLLSERVKFNFNKRNRRPPEDPVNALLSLGYTLLTKDMCSAIQTVGFDPYIGYLHRSDYGRPSLALDLIEEFRPIITDSIVLTVINKGIITENDFESRFDACFLNENGRKKFYRAYEERKLEKVKHPIFGYNISYSRAFELQVRFLAKVLLGEIKEYKPFLVR